MWQLHGSDPDVSFRLSAGDIRTIGRATGAQFIIDHPLVSRVHCRVTASDAGSLSVEDLGSTNGTFVNGARIDRPARLVAGDSLTVGRVTLTVQEGSAMLLHTAAVPPFMKNGFVIGCERTRQVVVIDPGNEVDELLAHIRIERLDPVAILLTHAHVDHVSGVARARRELQVPIWMHADDRPVYARAVEQGRLFGLEIEPLPPVDHYFAGDGVWGAVGDYEVSLRHTPGHCPGNVCFALTRAGQSPASEGLVVGDTLFAGSIGRTDLPGGDYPTLMRSITEVLFSYPDDTVVLPGHGPDTTIGRERRTNPFVLDWLQQTQPR